MTPLSANCNTDYTAFRKSGTRKVEDIKWIVLHDTEGGSAESVARFFDSPKAQGSAHLVVDDSECYRCLKDTEIAWGAPGANTKGFHIEQCGYAHWTEAQWMEHSDTIDRAAYKTAYHCLKFGIPTAWRSAADLKANKEGITSHLECSKAFGGNHTDPGPNWPRYYFMKRVRLYYESLISRF